MSVTMEDSEMAMAFLNGLPDRFDSLILAVDESYIDESQLTFELVQSRCIQEQQRHEQRDADALQKSQTAALMATRQSNFRKNASAETCVHCGKHRDSSRCYTKFPHLAPKGHPARALMGSNRNNGKALIAQQPNETDVTCENDFVCLLSKQPPHSIALQSFIHSTSSTGYWIIDSGCTSHVTHDRSAFVSYTPSSDISNLDLGANSSASIVGRGNIRIDLSQQDGSSKPCLLKNVLHVPNLRYQLLSVSSMSKLGVNVHFDGSSAQIVRKSDSSVVGTGTFRNGLYTLDCKPLKSTIPITSSQVALNSSLQLWHERLAHVNVSGIKSMVTRGVVKGIEVVPDTIVDDTCVGCVLGKSHRTPIPKASSSRATKLMELVHSDVCGPIEVQSLGGARYFVSFIDDFSKWTVVYFMRRKSEVLEYFKQFRTLAENRHSTKMGSLHIREYHCNEGTNEVDQLTLKVLRSDNGGEYLSNDFKRFLSDEGIHHQLTVYTPQQNGVAERMNRTLLDLARSMMHHKSLPKHFWAEALSTAV